MEIYNLFLRYVIEKCPHLSLYNSRNWDNGCMKMSKRFGPILVIFTPLDPDNNAVRVQTMFSDKIDRVCSTEDQFLNALDELHLLLKKNEPEISKELNNVITDLYIGEE